MKMKELSMLQSDMFGDNMVKEKIICMIYTIGILKVNFVIVLVI